MEEHRIEQNAMLGEGKRMREVRTCAKCGGPYLLPLEYENANPDIRDLCIDCIEEYVMGGDEDV